MFSLHEEVYGRNLVCNNKSIRCLVLPGASKGGKGERPPPPKPRKFAKDGEQPTPKPAMKTDSMRKIKFSLN